MPPSTGLVPPSPLPEFVYKITPEAPPDPIPEAYPLSDLDRQDGFIHMSTAWQVCSLFVFPLENPAPFSSEGVRRGVYS